MCIHIHGHIPSTHPRLHPPPHPPQVTVIDSSDYAKKIHSGMDPEDALEHAIRVYTNGKADPQPLLVCTTAEYDEQKSVILELKVGGG